VSEGLRDAVEVWSGSPSARILLSCEHATHRLPPPWSWPKEDLWIRGTHWSYDAGARALCAEFAARWAAPTVLANFTRLLADPNRAESSPELVRSRADGRELQLNRGVTAEDLAARLRYHAAYHAAFDALVGAARAPLLFAVHTFTPVYEGAPRSVEVGLLFDAEAALAERALTELRSAGFDARANEPYSGRAGLMYSVERHAKRHGRRALEIEVRQDLAAHSDARSRIAAALSLAFDL
jgi:predicted N-formylglutamate amidohydrolase